MDQIVQPSTGPVLEEPSAEPLPDAESNNLLGKKEQQTALGIQGVRVKEKNSFGKTINTLLIFICILLPFVGWAMGSLVNPEGIESDNPVMTVIYMLYFPIIIVSQPFLLIPLVVGLAIIISLFRRQIGRMMLSILLLLSVLVAAGTYYSVSTAPTQEEG